MTRQTRQRRLDAEERWPNLYQFVGCYLHQDWPDESDTPQVALDLAVAEHELEERQVIASQWWNWNAVEGSKADPRPAINDGLGIEVWFESPLEARQFMNTLYEKLVLSIRKEVKDWKP